MRRGVGGVDWGADPRVQNSDFFFPSQESEPISNYLKADVPAEVKQKIARMGVDTILKMVR